MRFLCYYRLCGKHVLPGKSYDFSTNKVTMYLNHEIGLYATDSSSTANATKTVIPKSTSLPIQTSTATILGLGSPFTSSPLSTPKSTKVTLIISIPNTKLEETVSTEAAVKKVNTSNIVTTPVAMTGKYSRHFYRENTSTPNLMTQFISVTPALPTTSTLSTNDTSLQYADIPTMQSFSLSRSCYSSP
ncbi:hypothetical protein SK128_019361, partial [Halocaridina rubra]